MAGRERRSTGKVAVVTGAARGLGRVEALELARLGARVVVNDLGTKGDGTGRDEIAGARGRRRDRGVRRRGRAALRRRRRLGRREGR